MARPAYQKSNLRMHRGHENKTEVKALQRDLRALGYLRSGIDGDFGGNTELAVKSLQYDLLNNVGESTGDDGPGPVSVVNFNRGRVFDVTGILDQPLAACLSEMIVDENFPKLPRSADAERANHEVIARLKNSHDFEVPIPFLVAMLTQESSLQHFQVPRGKNEDSYITVGLDRNSKKAGANVAITSRGYGAGQYTLFHHPPRASEVQDFMMDPVGNVSKAAREYRSKFTRFVNGPTSGTRADDRIAEVGAGPLRECKYERTDPKYQRDCTACLDALPTTTVRSGDPFYKGSNGEMAKTAYYKKAVYRDVPLRAEIPCDWPYASRRYNGAGVNSYHYQTIILQNVVRGGDS